MAVPHRWLFVVVVVLFFLEHVQHVWDHGGGRHVNNESNLLVLTPVLHSMMDDGKMILVPNMAGPIDMGYKVLFWHPQEL
jgi:hypothetical protein